MSSQLGRVTAGDPCYARLPRLTRERLRQGAVGLSIQPITGDAMNSIIYLVGLIVVVLAILSFLGLR